MQWLNPKAWLASMAGLGAYAANGDGAIVLRFSAIHFRIYYASITCWAYAGSHLSHCLHVPCRVRIFNRAMAVLLAVLLVVSAVCLVQA